MYIYMYEIHVAMATVATLVHITVVTWITNLALPVVT